MTPEERERMTSICQRIATEQDRDVFTQLVKELNDLLSQKDHRLKDRPEDIERNSKIASLGSARSLGRPHVYFLLGCAVGGNSPFSRKYVAAAL